MHDQKTDEGVLGVWLAIIAAHQKLNNLRVSKEDLPQLNIPSKSCAIVVSDACFSRLWRNQKVITKEGCLSTETERLGGKTSRLGKPIEVVAVAFEKDNHWMLEHHIPETTHSVLALNRLEDASR